MKHFPDILAPYVATPNDVVTRMLSLANVGPQDVVHDLGCGDGRVVIAAARDRGARGLGIDVEDHWIEIATEQAVAAGVEDRARFVIGDASTHDASAANVVFIYLVHWSTQRVGVRLQQQLEPGARVVSLSFPIDSWTPTATESFVDEAGIARRLFLYVRISD